MHHPWRVNGEAIDVWLMFAFAFGSTMWRTSCCARLRIMLVVSSGKDSYTKKNWVRWLDMLLPFG